MARSGMNTSGADLAADAPKPKLTKEAFRRGMRIFRYVLRVGCLLTDNCMPWPTNLANV